MTSPCNVGERVLEIPVAKYFREATDATLTRLYPAWESAYAGLRKNHVGHFSHNDGRIAALPPAGDGLF
jgi:hypothetical protein